MEEGVDLTSDAACLSYSSRSASSNASLHNAAKSCSQPCISSPVYHQFLGIRVCAPVDRDCPVLRPQLLEPHAATFPISVNTFIRAPWVRWVLIASDTRLESSTCSFGRSHLCHSCFDPWKNSRPLYFAKHAQASMFELKFSCPTDPTFQAPTIPSLHAPARRLLGAFRRSSLSQCREDNIPPPKWYDVASAFVVLLFSLGSRWGSERPTL